MKNNLGNDKISSEYFGYIEHIIIEELSEKNEIDLSANFKLNKFLREKNIRIDLSAYIAEMSKSRFVRVEGTKLTLLMDDNFMDEE